MLTKINRLIMDLNDSGIRYCHWKSNVALAESLAGQTDIDLLIDRNDAHRFRTLLGQRCFKPATMDTVAAFPSVEHYLGLDEVDGTLVHVHAYYRVLTGESLTKNYRFPIEEMLLQDLRYVGSVPVPAKGAELVVFILRMMLKHTSLLELGLLSRYWGQVGEEIEWLYDASSMDRAVELLQQWLPVVDVELFSACVAALRAPASLGQRIRLGLRLRGQLRPYTRHSPLWAWASGVKKFGIMGFRRLTRSKLALVPQTGGAVIAFVGPEATGKSTLLAEVGRDFGRHLKLDRIHAGKPKSTLLGALPNLFVPALRALFPSYRSTNVDARLQDKSRSASGGDSHQAQGGDETVQPSSKYPLVYGLRSVMLAYDRHALLKRAFRRAANGSIVLCDRYPSARSGVPDSPQLAHLPTPPHRFAPRRLLAQTEGRLYRQIPPPDLVIYLCAPLELTLVRNASRGKREPEAYVRRRHGVSSNLVFSGTTVCKIDTSQPLAQTILEVKKIIWNAL